MFIRLFLIKPRLCGGLGILILESSLWLLVRFNELYLRAFRSGCQPVGHEVPTLDKIFRYHKVFRISPDGDNLLSLKSQFNRINGQNLIGPPEGVAGNDEDVRNGCPFENGPYRLPDPEWVGVIFAVGFCQAKGIVNSSDDKEFAGSLV